MQYEIKYNYQETIGSLYMSLIGEQDLMAEDIVYSARKTVAKFLGTSRFKIISIQKCI